MEAFEASGSVANTGTGTRREGEKFERLISDLWLAFENAAVTEGAVPTSIFVGLSRRGYTMLSVDSRSLYIPSSTALWPPPPGDDDHRWLEITFGVTDLVAAFPGEEEVIQRYAPSTGPYAADQYPEIYKGLTTKFDDSVVLVDDEVLREKILLEYKTAKSTLGVSIDGNAHERLSFQIMQYLEVATRYTRCSLQIITNGAFIRYRNKYHANFQVQADRLSNFGWFAMGYASTVPEYEQFLEGLWDWLFKGTPLRRSIR